MKLRKWGIVYHQFQQYLQKCMNISLEMYELKVKSCSPTEGHDRTHYTGYTVFVHLPSHPC